MKALVICALLAGCTTTSLDTLYQQQAACWGTGEDCSGYADAITKKMDRQEARRYRNINRCPGMIEYCDETMKGCGNSRRAITDEYSCVSNNFFNGIF